MARAVAPGVSDSPTRRGRERQPDPLLALYRAAFSVAALTAGLRGCWPEAYTPGLLLSAFLSQTVIPALGAGRWCESAAEVIAFVRLIDSRKRGSHTEDRARLRLLVAPCLWALACVYPEDAPAPPSSERIERAVTVIDLFAALRHCPDWPASVLLSAGGLAALSRPPGARRWVERASRVAREHGAWQFERFFRAVVTPLSPDPSSE
jgi:hypothetical protein